MTQLRPLRIYPKTFGETREKLSNMVAQLMGNGWSCWRALQGWILPEKESNPEESRAEKWAEVLLTMTLAQVYYFTPDLTDPQSNSFSRVSILKPKQPWLNTPVHFDTSLPKWPQCVVQTRYMVTPGEFLLSIILLLIVDWFSHMASEHKTGVCHS